MASTRNGEHVKTDGDCNNKDFIAGENIESLRCSSGVGGDARARRLGRLETTHTAIFVCDLQERFAPSIAHFDTVVNNAERILKAANILGIPMVATEQYPKGLGSTVEPLKSLLSEQPFSKTQFTMLVGDVENRLDNLRRQTKPTTSVDTIVLVGIETHVCIIATCIDLVHRGFNVHVVADAVSSRTQTDRQLALERMRTIGAHINTTESIILGLVGDAAHTNFKEIQRLIKTLSPDTGLLNTTSLDGSSLILNDNSKIHRNNSKSSI